MGLTSFQADVLRRCGEIQSRGATTAWVGRFPASSKPTYSVLRALERKGLVACDRGSYWPVWSLTEAGREALASLPQASPVAHQERAA